MCTKYMCFSVAHKSTLENTEGAIKKWTLQKNWQPDEDKRNEGTIKNGHSRTTDNIGYTRRR